MTHRQDAKRLVALEVERVSVEPDPRPDTGWTYRATMYQEGDGVDYPSDLDMSARELRSLLKAHAPVGVAPAGAKPAA